MEIGINSSQAKTQSSETYQTQKTTKLRDRGDFIAKLGINKSTRLDYIHFFNTSLHSHLLTHRISSCDKLKRLYNLIPNQELNGAVFKKEDDDEINWYLDELFKSEEQIIVKRKVRLIDLKKTVEEPVSGLRTLDPKIYGRVKKKKKLKHHRKSKQRLVSGDETNEEDGEQQQADAARIKPFFAQKDKKTRLKMPNYMKSSNFSIENELTRTISRNENDVNYKFLIMNRNRMRQLVFCSPNGLRLLSEFGQWQASGTYHVNSKHYYQLYVISVWFMGRMVPCVFALMHRRRKKDYDNLVK